MKRLFLASFDYLREKDSNISLATSSILAYLKTLQSTSKSQLSNYEIFHRQYNVKRADVSVISDTFLHDVKKLCPDTLATGVYIWNEAFISHALNTLRTRSSNSGIVTILGGPQITYNPKGTLESTYPYGDIFIRGYAEQSMAFLLDSLLSNRSRHHHVHIDGVHWRGDNDAGLKSIYDLNVLPSPLLTPGVLNHHGYLRLETKRGCPFTCAFCQHKDSYEKKLSCSEVRIRQEVAAIVAQQITDISIVDPIFNSGTNYANVLSEFIRNSYKGRLSLQSRFEMVKEDYLDACVKLLNGGARIELEFGIQTIIPTESKVIRRLNNLKRVVAAAKSLRDRHIPFEVSLIYGLPLQTTDSFLSSLEWVREFLKPNLIHAWPLMLLKGTEMWDLRDTFELREKVLNEDLDEVNERRIFAGIPHVVESSTFTELDWNQMKRIALALNN